MEFVPFSYIQVLTLDLVPASVTILIALRNYREFVNDLCCGEKHFFGILKIGQIHCSHRRVLSFNMSHIAEYILI